MRHVTNAGLRLRALPLLLGLALLGACARGRAEPGSTASPMESADAGPGLQTIHAAGVEWSVDYFPIGVMSAADAEGRWHLRVHLEGGRVTRYEHVGPSGQVHKTSGIVYDADGGSTRRVVNGYGVEVETIRLTKEGRESRIARSGNPLSEGCAQFIYTLDAHGDSVGRACVDGEGHPNVDANGCVRLGLTFDPPHVLVARRCLDERGEPALDTDGVHLSRYTRDARTQLTSERYFDRKEGATLSVHGCAARQFDYDAAGNLSNVTCLGADGSPASYPNSTVVGERRVFDANGCMLAFHYVDTRGARASFGKWSGSVFTRDLFCSETSRETRDASDAIVSAFAKESARWQYVLDAQGQLTEQRCFDAKGKPWSCHQVTKIGGGGSVLRFAYDDRGRLVSTKAFDAAGRPARRLAAYPHETVYRHDDRGLVVEAEHRDAAGKPSPALGNVARVTYAFNAQGAETSQKQFDKDGAPVNGTTGAHELRRRYDESRRLEAIELRDAKGELVGRSDLIFNGVRWPNNAAELRIVRDGATTKNRFLDRSGNELKEVDCTSTAVRCER